MEGKFQPRISGLRWGKMREAVIREVPTPSYVIEEKALRENLECLKNVMDRTGCHILLAQKAYSIYQTYPLIGQFLSGTTASSLYEAKLGYEEMGKPMGKETHIYAPAYREEDFPQILSYCDHIVFNTPAQWKKYKGLVESQKRHISCGLRINPEYSEIETDLYNPCFANSRMGTIRDKLKLEDLEGLEGLHFHTLCEQNADALKHTLDVVEEKFGDLLGKMKWINFGGGHHITRADYEIETLISCILHMQETYGLEVYLEPGEAVALHAGYLVSSVLEVMENGMDLAILDTSAACHMPDVLEMPYRPEIVGAAEAGKKAHTYRLGGPTCLAGDVIGDYSFDRPLKGGDRLVFCDMAIYSMVKNNTFNGIGLPCILLEKEDGQIEEVRRFGYEDFKSRL